MRRWIALAAWLAGTWTLFAAVNAQDKKPPAGVSTQASEHWAFRPVVRPPLPNVRGTSRTAVDRFILAALEAKGLRLNPEADRTTLIRRLSFDLIGLPPTIDEIESFLADRSPDAYERL